MTGYARRLGPPAALPASLDMPYIVSSDVLTSEIRRVIEHIEEIIWDLMSFSTILDILLKPPTNAKNCEGHYTNKLNTKRTPL